MLCNCVDKSVSFFTRMSKSLKRIRLVKKACEGSFNFYFYGINKKNNTSNINSKFKINISELLLKKGFGFLVSFFVKLLPVLPFAFMGMIVSHAAFNLYSISVIDLYTCILSINSYCLIMCNLNNFTLGRRAMFDFKNSYIIKTMPFSDYEFLFGKLFHVLSFNIFFCFIVSTLSSLVIFFFFDSLFYFLDIIFFNFIININFTLFLSIIFIIIYKTAYQLNKLAPVQRFFNFFEFVLAMLFLILYILFVYNRNSDGTSFKTLIDFYSYLPSFNIYRMFLFNSINHNYIQAFLFFILLMILTSAYIYFLKKLAQNSYLSILEKIESVDIPHESDLKWKNKAYNEDKYAEKNDTSLLKTIYFYSEKNYNTDFLGNNFRNLKFSVLFTPYLQSIIAILMIIIHSPVKSWDEFILMIDKFIYKIQFMIRDSLFELFFIVLTVSFIWNILNINYLAITVFSKNSASFRFLKSMPVSDDLIFKSHQLSILKISLLISFLIIPFIIFLSVYVNIYLALVCMGLYIQKLIFDMYILPLVDLRKLNLDWENEIELMKNNIKVLQIFLLLVVIYFPIIIFFIILNIFFSNLTILPLSILFLFVIFVIIVGEVLLSKKIRKKLMRKVL